MTFRQITRLSIESHFNGVDKYPNSIPRNISVLIILRHIQLLDWSRISRNKYPTSIRGNKYPRHIKLIEFGVLSLLINIQDISS